MTDIVDPAARSKMMAGIRSRDTRPEVALRRALHARGYRFVLHDRRLPGRPDVVLPRWNAAINVHGCFWHRHQGCPRASTPTTRPEFWSGKFAANVERDARNATKLLAMGWRIATIWECALGARRIAGTADTVADWLRSTDGRLEVG